MAEVDKVEVDKVEVDKVEIDKVEADKRNTAHSHHLAEALLQARLWQLHAGRHRAPVLQLEMAPLPEGSRAVSAP